MTKNKLEKLFSESMHLDKELWAMKLISNPLTHQNTPADYIIDYVSLLGKFKVILIECKMVTLDDNDKGRLAFKRLKQMHDLLNFESVRPEHHDSYFCIAYWQGRWDQSDIYIVPAKLVYDVVKKYTESGTVSLNRENARQEFFTYRAKLENGLINFNIIKAR